MAWEADFLDSMKHLRSPVMDKIMWFFSFLGDGGWFWIVTAIVLLVLVKTRKIGLDAALSLLITFIITSLIVKNIVERTRPYEAYDFLESLIGKQKDSSFPSGHAANGFAVAVSIFINNKKLGIPFVCIAAIITFSRLYNVVHYPTDVMAGLAFGLTIPILVHVMVKKLIYDKVVEKKPAKD